MSPPLDILRLFPDVAAIGRPKLQDYCHEWLQRPIAQQHGVTHLIVGSDLLLTVNIDDNRARFVDHRVLVPTDELLGYIIDRHFTDAETRRRLHNQVREHRKRLGDAGTQFDVTAGRVGLLWIKCKNPACDVSLESSQHAVEGQLINCPPCTFTCPECGHTDTYDGSDLHLRLDG